MYEAKQNKEKVSRRIDSGEVARLGIKFVNKADANRNFIQKMLLTPRGALTGQLGRIERSLHGMNLFNNTNINLYINGVCYDAVAFVRYLLGANISPDNIVDINAQNWLPFFNFQAGQQWLGGNIPQGRAVGFQRFSDRNFFHAAISLGGTKVRGINGLFLGAGWNSTGDKDLTTIPRFNGIFKNPNGNGRDFMNIWISNL